MQSTAEQFAWVSCIQSHEKQSCEFIPAQTQHKINFKNAYCFQNFYLQELKRVFDYCFIFLYSELMEQFCRLDKEWKLDTPYPRLRDKFAGTKEQKLQLYC